VDKYSVFVNKYIETRKNIIEDRAPIIEWGIHGDMPSFLTEKMEEIKMMTMLGIDNFVIKCLALFIEEILINILISDEIKQSDEYVTLLSKYKKKYGHEILNMLKSKNLIIDDDYQFCSKYLHDEAHGGERLRNIEVHNLLSDKISKFEIREEVLTDLDDFGRQFIMNTIKSKPGFVHIGARDMVTREIANEVAKLHDLLNRNVNTLSKINYV